MLRIASEITDTCNHPIILAIIFSKVGSLFLFNKFFSVTRPAGHWGGSLISVVVWSESTNIYRHDGGCPL